MTDIQLLADFWSRLLSWGSYSFGSSPFSCAKRLPLPPLTPFPNDRHQLFDFVVTWQAGSTTGAESCLLESQKAEAEAQARAPNHALCWKVGHGRFENETGGGGGNSGGRRGRRRGECSGPQEANRSAGHDAGDKLSNGPRSPPRHDIGRRDWARRLASSRATELVLMGCWRARFDGRKRSGVGS